MPTPSEVLAARIAERLVAEGLMTPEQTERVLPELAGGTMKPEDWRFAMEMSDVEGESDDD